MGKIRALQGATTSYFHVVPSEMSRVTREFSLTSAGTKNPGQVRELGVSIEGRLYSYSLSNTCV